MKIQRLFPMREAGRRLWDAHAAARRGMVYGLLVVSLAAVFFGLEFLIEKYIYNNDEVVDIIAATAGAFAFAKLQNVFEQMTDHTFFRAQYDYAEAVNMLNDLLGKTIDLEELLALIADFFMATIKPERIAFVFDDRPNAAVFVNPAIAQNKPANGPDNKGVPGDGRNGHRYAATIPLVSKEGTIATILVGPKLSGERLRTQDEDLFAVIAHQAGMAIENARLYAALQQHSEELEKRVAEKTERIRQMYAAQSKFLGDVAHEFQTPLAILKGNIGILAKKNVAGRANAVYVATTTLDRLSRLVTNLLDIAKLNFGKEKFKGGTVNVRTLLEEARDDCIILAEDKGVSLSLASDAGLFVRGDKDKLKEVILNLVSNALKHTPARGEIKLLAKRVGANIEIAVADTGKGIPAENLPRIFDRFYKINRRGIEEGSGIGLHLCRRIVEAHSGTIVAESEPGLGSRFIIHLPVVSRLSPRTILRENGPNNLAESVRENIETPPIKNVE